MKFITDVKSNIFFSQKEKETTFQLEALLELVICYTDGKHYHFNEKERKMIAATKISETRLLCDTQSLQNLITDLQLHLTKLRSFENNAEQVNGLVKHIVESDEASTVTIHKEEKP